MADARGRKAIRTAIETRTFAPAYYLYGEDDYLKDDAIRRLVDAAVDPATRDFNLEIRRATELDAETLGSLLSTPPMMADRRAVVVRDAGALKKDARTLLDRYLRAPADDVLLVLSTPAGGKVDKGLCESCALAIDFAPLDSRDVEAWIVRFTEKDLRATITPEAATLLHNALGSDLAQLAMELEKLANYAGGGGGGGRGGGGGGGGTIDEAAVSAVVGVRKEETLGALLDAVADRDAVRSLALLPGVLQQPKTTAVSIVIALSTQTLALAWGRALRDRGTPAARLQNEFFGLLKESSSSYTGRSWGDAVRAWARAVDRWSSAELDRALELLLDADAALKETRLSSDEQLLTNLVLALAGDGRRIAA